MDAIVMTGGLAHDSNFISMIKERVVWLASVMDCSGEEEIEWRG